MKFINLLKKELSELITVQMLLGLLVSLGIFGARQCYGHNYRRSC